MYIMRREKKIKIKGFHGVLGGSGLTFFMRESEK